MAKWILDEEATNKNREDETYGGPVYICSECENEPAVDEMNDMPWLSPYCPWCGAEMEGCGEEQDRAYAIDAEIREHRKALADKRYDEIERAIEEDDKEKGVKRVIKKSGAIVSMSVDEVKKADVGYLLVKGGYDDWLVRNYPMPVIIYGRYLKSTCHMVVKMPGMSMKRPVEDREYEEYGKTWIVFDEKPILSNEEVDALWQST